MGARNKYPARLMLTPQTENIELRVDTSAGTDTITPAAGKRIRVFQFYVSQFVVGVINTTLRGTLAFGTNHTTDPSKILGSYRQQDDCDDAGSEMLHINVVGGVDEVLTLTNVTFTGTGHEITRVIVYYQEV